MRTIDLGSWLKRRQYGEDIGDIMIGWLDMVVFLQITTQPKQHAKLKIQDYLITLLKTL